MKLVVDTRKVQKMQLQAMDAGTLFFDEDGDVCMALCGAKVLCLSDTSGGVPFIREDYYYDDNYATEYELVSTPITLTNEEDDDA